MRAVSAAVSWCLFYNLASNGSFISIPGLEWLIISGLSWLIYCRFAFEQTWEAAPAVLPMRAVSAAVSWCRFCIRADLVWGLLGLGLGLELGVGVGVELGLGFGV
jgi:hypothetical protein